MRLHSDNRGETLVEILVAIGIFAVAGFAVLLLVVSAYRGVLVGGQRTRAMAYAREAWEATTSIERNAYNKLKAGTYGLSNAGGSWAFSGSSDTNGIYTRTVTVAAVNRDGSGNIATSGTSDIATRKVTTTVSWPFEGGTKTFSLVDYLSNWDAQSFFEDTTSNFSDGTFSSTVASTAHDADGSVGLQQLASTWSCAKAEGAVDNTGTAAANDVATSGNYAFLVTNTNASTGEFIVVDKSTPTNPTVVANVELNANANAISISGQYAYVATGDDAAELRVINITTPTSPSIAGTLNLTGTEDALDVVASGSRAYLVRTNVAAGNEFYTINVGTPSSPSSMGSVDIGASGNGIALSGTYAYVVTDNGSGEFKAVNVSVDASPSVSTTVNLSPTTVGNEVAINGSYAYVVTSNNASAGELFVIDISNPLLASVSGSAELGNGANTIAMNGTTAFVASSTVTAHTLQIVDASTPSAPTIGANQLISTAAYNGLFWDGTRLFAASQDTDAELLILRPQLTADWACAERKSEINLTGNTQARAVYAVGTTLYVGTAANAGGPEFFIYDVTTPTAPTLTGSLEVGDDINDLVVSGNFAYLATSGNAAEMRVVSIATPSLPASVGTLNLSGSTDGQAINISGTKVLLTQGATLYNVNVTVPASPASLGSVSVTGIGYRIEVYNATYAYIADADDAGEVKVINYSANTPAVSASINIAGTSDGRGLWIKGTQLYIATDNAAGAGLFIYDISAPAAPTATGSLNLGQAARAVAADDNETFAFAGVNQVGQEMKIVDALTPSSPSIAGISNILNGLVNDLYFANDTVYVATQATTGEVVIIGKSSGGGGGGSYLTSGTYDSSIFDAGSTANWNTIQWSEYTTGCSSGDVRVQIRTATTSGGLASELWQGPDGEDADQTDYFTDPNGELIDTTHNGDRYMQYRTTLTGDGTCTQYLTDITASYTPY